MNTPASARGRIRLGLIAAGPPARPLGRFNTVLGQAVAAHDRAATRVSTAVEARLPTWHGALAAVGEQPLRGAAAAAAFDGLIDAGVGVIAATVALDADEVDTAAALNRARALGVPVLVAAGQIAPARAVVLARADPTLPVGGVSWEVAVECCRIGGLGDDHGAALGVLVGEALAALSAGVPRTELRDALRAWAVMPQARMAS